MKLLPVALNVAGQRCVVFGAGSVALRKAESLLECEAQVTAIAPHFGEEWQNVPGLEQVPRPYLPGDCAGALLIFACTDDLQVNAQIADEARAAGIWCNIADDAQTSNFHSMATLRRGEIAIAIATGGGSPALSRHLKAQISETIGPEYASLLEILSSRREVLPQFFAAQSQRAQFWRAVLAGPVLGLLRDGERNAAERWIDNLLNTTNQSTDETIS